MPASRWNQYVFDILSWFDGEGELQDNLYFNPITPRLVDKEGTSENIKPGNGGDATTQIPAELPILPLRGVVVYPQDSRAPDNRPTAFDSAGR
jgi:hypothetical protein